MEANMAATPQPGDGAAVPLTDPLAEAVRLTDAAHAASVSLRITGGVAVALQCPSARSAPLQREYADIDCVGRGRERQAIAALLVGAGYLADETFNALHGERRLFFWDPVNEKQLDVFLDRAELCHELELASRLDVDPRTLSLADLLLMKLQIVETNRKDFLDMLALLADQPFTEDDSGINLRYLADLMAHDWGLWRTTTMVAERVAEFALAHDGFEQADHVVRQTQAYREALDAAPKSRAWKLRARIGDRKRWYELPEEVD
ncbi:MAG TPA: hypothetical protein VFV85_02460 [Conexibacter sp.]|nr:hypothetical protein [Conexibacter sp.]